jgi:enolase
LYSYVREGKYDLDFKNPNSDKSKWIDAQELTNLYLEFIKDFPVVSIEDPFDQDHWDAWTNITANTSIQVKNVISVRVETKWIIESYNENVSIMDYCTGIGLVRGIY